MLNIPDEVKKLLKDDNVTKNFRVHFPNGERADITNENIVAESVVLDEALSSESQLRFGLCDVAHLEFEVFGIENIKGCIIECMLEIYCDSSIQDSTYKEDIGTYVYSIPYGSFVVFSCKKQADMSHRQVVAYGGNTIQGNQLPKSVISGLTTAILKNDKKKLSFDTMFKCLKPDLIEGYSSTSGNANFKTSTIHIYDKNGDYMTNVRISYAPFAVFPNSVDAQNVIAFKPFYMYPPDVLSNLINQLKEKVAEIKRQGGFSASTNDKVGSLIPYYATKTNPASVVALYTDADYFDYSNIDDIFDVEKVRFVVGIDWEDSKNIFSTAAKLAPVSGGVQRTTNYVYLPHTFSFADGTTISLRLSITGGSGFYCEYKTLPLFASTDELAVSTTYIKRSKKTNIAPSAYIFSQESIMQKWIDYIDAYYELNGKFGNYARDGIFKSLTVDTRQIDARLSRNDYESVWYDDDYSKGIGAIYIQYNDKSKDDVAQTIDLVDDYNDTLYKTYDMSGNRLIDLNSLSDDAIAELLTEAGESMKNIKYMPSEVVARGMPWIEVGDVLTIETEDDGDITVLVEKRTLSGIQYLQDKIECVDEEQTDLSTVGYDIESNTIIIGG